MRLAQVTATIIFLQGVVPLVVLGAWRPGGWFLATAASIYVCLAYGLWSGRRWALPVAFALTLPQLLFIGSSLVSWRFFVGISLGAGIKPALNVLTTPINVYFQVTLRS